MPTAKRRRPGPYSKDDTLSSLDRRTRAGRVLRSVEANLTADVGGDPSTGERLLIQAVAVKATRLHLLSEQLLEGDQPGEDGHHALAWANSMRLDLVALGLRRRLKLVEPSGTVDRLADHYARPYAPQGEGATA